jgi:type II secretory pathway pseudopilin PulG
MRILVSAACIAVIAAVGYYFWKEWSEAQRAAREREQLAFEQQMLAEAKQAALGWLYERAGAKPDQPNTVRAFCENVANGWVIDPESRSILARCQLTGIYP